MMLGLDYASVDGNKPPDLAAARAAGLRFAFVRATYSKWADATALRDRDAIRKAGLVFGAYLFPVMDETAAEPEEQVAAFVLAAELDRSNDFAPVLDLEWPGGIAKTGRSRTDVAAWIERAVGALHAAYGCLPIVYSSTRVLAGTDDDALAGAATHALEGCPLWLARYPYKTRIDAQLKTYEALTPPPTPNGDPDGWWIHQFQGDALRFPGFSATVDLDRFNTLELGATGSRVVWVQKRLGLIEPDFGAATSAAVKAFQVKQGLEADGIVGAATFAALSWLS